MLTSSRPRRLNWNRTGALLRDLDPERYERVLALASRYVDILAGSLVSEPIPPKPSRSEQRAQKRRKAFKVIQGGLS